MTLTFGSIVQVDANGFDAISIDKLTSSLLICAFEDTLSGDIEARTISIAGGVPSPNAAASTGDTQTAGVGETVLVALTATSAMLIYEYFTGVTNATRARILTVSGTTITVNAALDLSEFGSGMSAAKIDSTNVLYVYRNASVVRAVVLSVSGTTITENSIITVEAANNLATQAANYSSVKGMAGWATFPTIRATAEIVNISGTTLTATTAQQIYNDTAGNDNDNNFIINLSSTKNVQGTRRTTPDNYEFRVLTLNGDTFDIGTEATVARSGTTNYVKGAKLTDTALVCAYQSATQDIDGTKYNIGGVDSDELTADGNDTIDTNETINQIRMCPVDDTHVAILFWGSTNGTSIIIATATAAATLALAPMTKPADIDAAGEFIYLALLDGGTPILTKISTDLDADGTTVFDPGAGDNIGVECGRFNSDVVWVAGQFDGTNVVEKSEDGGSSFVVKDDAAIGGVRSFVMGPDSDDKILLFDEDNGDILETKNDGESWTTINSAVTPEVNTIARLGQNVEESVFGNQGAANNSINYSVNSGDDLEDFQSGVYPNANATRVVVN
jgi:hypothetical protein